MNTQSSPTVQKVSFLEFNRIVPKATPSRRVVVRSTNPAEDESLYVIAFGDHIVLALVEGIEVLEVESDIIIASKSNGRTGKYEWAIYEAGPPAALLARVMQAGRSIWPG